MKLSECCGKRMLAHTRRSSEIKQSQKNIRETLKELRRIINHQNAHPAAKRMAYFAEYTLRWATGYISNCPRPEDTLEIEVEFLLKELSQSK